MPTPQSWNLVSHFPFVAWNCEIFLVWSGSNLLILFTSWLTSFHKFGIFVDLGCWVSLMLRTSCFTPWCFQRSSWRGANTTGQLDFGEPVPSSFSCWGSLCEGRWYLPEPVLRPRFLLHQHHHVQVGQGVLCVRWCWFTWQLGSDWNCCNYLKFDSDWLKIWNRMTASILKQDPNAKRFNKMLIYYNMDTYCV